MASYWAERALLPGGVTDSVLLECGDHGRLTSVQAGVERPAAGTAALRGLALPGLVDAHSHAFHRALRGRTGGGDFWAWRAEMYRLVDRLDPDRLLALAAAAFGELVLAGITTVHEFHYLHEPAGMDDAVCEAARLAGIRLVLLDTCYLRSGFDGRPLDPVQQRFTDGDVDRWAARAGKVAAAHPETRVGAAIHSVRAVDPHSMGAVASWARERGAPLHLHLSEQSDENEACLAATGRTPTELADEHGVLGVATTAVHCTHVTEADIGRLGRSGTTACLCPTTERDLADGIGPAAALVTAGCPLTLGTDSHAVVDLFEEARAVELDERLATGRRGHHLPGALLAAASAGATIAVDEVADLCVLSLGSVRLAGIERADPVPMIVAAATAADVTDVIVDGRHVVRDRAHTRMDVATDLHRAIEALLVTWDLLITEAAGGTAIAVDGDRIAFAGPAASLPSGTRAEVVWPVEGRLVTPGLVDCHTHLVFGGDRSAEWEQRLGGATYEAIAAAGGGIRSTVAATRSSTEDDLLEGASRRLAALATGGVTTVEVKSGYGLDLDTELRMLRVARRLSERVPVDVVTTFLGAHSVPPEHDGDPDGYLGVVCDEVLPAVAAARLADAVDGFCERIAFSTEQLEPVFSTATGLGLRVKLHADQLSDAGGAALAAAHGALSADHLEHASAEGIAAMAAAGTVAVLLPGAAYVLDDATRPPVDALREAGVPMAVATDCNPGTSPLLSLRLALHLACTRFGLTVSRGDRRRDGPRRRRARVGRRGRPARARRPRRPGGLGRRTTGARSSTGSAVTPCTPCCIADGSHGEGRRDCAGCAADRPSGAARGVAAARAGRGHE